VDKERAPKPLGIVLPVLASIAAMAAFQIGAAFAKTLFPVLGPQGAAALRLGLGALMLLAIARPWRTWRRDAPLLPLIGLGASTAAVIVMFYLAINRLPLGVAISLQFLGPLGIAVFGSRRPTDLVWATLGAAGVWLLVGSGVGAKSLDPIGIGWALGAAAGWAGYILCGRTASVALGKSTAALATSIAAILILPAGVWQAGSALLSPALLPMALLVALFSTAIPFTLELYAMAQMPARTFAVLMNLEPAFGVLSGLVILNERLSGAQMAGVAVVITAAGGAAWSGAGETALID
jgi:inner membrane transporter RhtA